MEFMNVLKNLRNKKEISQVELAKDLGLSAGTIGMYESGKRKPSFEALESIADYFNVSIDYLVGKESGSTYYLDPEVAGIAQELYDRPELKTLFDTTRKVSKEDIEMVSNLIMKFKENE